MLASKAIYVTGQIRDSRAIEILHLGATREERMVRIAAATTFARYRRIRQAPCSPRSYSTPMLSAGAWPSRPCRHR